MWCEAKTTEPGWSINLTCTCWSLCISKWQWQWLHPADFLSECRFQVLTELHRVSMSLEILYMELWVGLLSRMTEKNFTISALRGCCCWRAPGNIREGSGRASQLYPRDCQGPAPRMETTKCSCYALAISPCFSKKHFPLISGLLSFMKVLQYRVPVEPHRKSSKGELWNRPTRLWP